MGWRLAWATLNDQSQPTYRNYLKETKVTGGDGGVQTDFHILTT